LPLRKIVSFLPQLFMLLCLGACVSPSRYHAATVLEIPGSVAGEATQALLVTEEGLWPFPVNRVYAVQKRGDKWLMAFEPFSAVVGRNGFAPYGEKREGDGRTPSGVYRLGHVFGYAESVNTKMPYRQALADDLWVDDPGAPDYNRWVKRGETFAASYEKMKRDDDQYKYGVVIEYNTDPVIKGRGSAIFFHVWAGARSTTAGCIAVSEEDIRKILTWLDPGARPVILVNPDTITEAAPFNRDAMPLPR
jgi:L,D-peptidoglycan transpeptidase YkuD (ErfK/YbiS/YcfS/YnhG family)